LTVYFISGQAADEHLFKNLVLPPNHVIKHVQWIEPLKNETLADYAKRLSLQISTAGSYILIGVSFGGIVAIELNKILQPKYTIIISSIATKCEHPPHLKFFHFFKLHKLMPGAFYKLYNPFVNWCFGAQTNREKELLRYYLKGATKNYMKWAATEILNWKNESRPKNLLHIHGTSDRIFPHQFTHADIKIKNGTHLMIHNRAEEMSKILTQKINSIPS
jgi:hypothetical protein